MEQSVKQKCITDILLFVYCPRLNQVLVCKIKRGTSKLSEDKPARKRTVTYKALKKWSPELDSEHQIALWLDCDTVTLATRKHWTDWSALPAAPLRQASEGDVVSANDGLLVQIQLVWATSKTTFGQISICTQWCCERKRKSCRLGDRFTCPYCAGTV